MAAQTITLGQNIKAQISEDGKSLHLFIDLTEEGVPSKSGKSMVIASTHGNRVLSTGESIGINIYRKGDSQALAA